MNMYFQKVALAIFSMLVVSIGILFVALAA